MAPEIEAFIEKQRFQEIFCRNLSIFFAVSWPTTCGRPTCLGFRVPAGVGDRRSVAVSQQARPTRTATRLVRQNVAFELSFAHPRPIGAGPWNHRATIRFGDENGKNLRRRAVLQPTH
jgi:hypothetical protein